VLLDAFSYVSAVPTVFDKVYTGVEGGVGATSNYPLGTRALQLPDSRVASRFLDVTSRPDRVAVCACERQSDSTVAGALHFLNGETLNSKIRSDKSRIVEWVNAKLTDEEIINKVFMLGYSRKPTEKEMKACREHLSKAEADKRREAVEDLFWLY